MWEQFVPYRTRQDNGENPRPAANYVDSSITHLVPGYNFSAGFGVSLNVPVGTWTNLFVAPLLDSPSHYVVVDTRTRKQRFYRLHVYP